MKKAVSIILILLMFMSLSVVNAEGNSNTFAAGPIYSVAVKNDGTVWTWGAHGTNGNAGEASNSPIQLESLKNIKLVAIGGYNDGMIYTSHALALSKDGTVWAWGSNRNGKLGDATEEYRNEPVLVKDLKNVVAVSAGSDHSVALMKDGTVWTWGSNSSGQLGDGTNVSKKVPVKVAGIKDVIAVSAGACQTIALKKDGTVWGWGSNYSYALGFDDRNKNYAKPVQIKGFEGVTAISAGENNSVALKKDGSVWVTGANTDGAILSPVMVKKPTRILGLEKIIGISSYSDVIALKKDGTVWRWGKETTFDSATGKVNELDAAKLKAEKVAGLANVTSISNGEAHKIVVKKDGSMWSWGFNYYGQIGDGKKPDNSKGYDMKNTPVKCVFIFK